MLDECKHCPCVHAAYGCEFRGTKSETGRHLGVCVYDSIRGFLHKNAKNDAEMKEMVSDLHDEVSTLSDRTKGVEGLLSSQMEHYDMTIKRVLSALQETNRQLGEVRRELQQLKKSTGMSIVIIILTLI